MPKEGGMPQREFADIGELRACAGQEVAISDWMEVTQERIDTFADATNDHQWIHVDEERCRQESPFGTTIAHGFLTLSLIPQFSYATISIRQKFRMSINYGCNKVRFMSPVPCGSQIRNRYQLLEVSDVDGGWQTRWQVTVEIAGKEKPACVAETLSRYYRVE
jgi:acyl dehydratase